MIWMMARTTTCTSSKINRTLSMASPIATHDLACSRTLANSSRPCRLRVTMCNKSTATTVTRTCCSCRLLFQRSSDMSTVPAWISQASHQSLTKRPKVEATIVLVRIHQSVPQCCSDCAFAVRLLIRVVVVVVVQHSMTLARMLLFTTMARASQLRRSLISTPLVCHTPHAVRDLWRRSQVTDAHNLLVVWVALTYLPSASSLLLSNPQIEQAYAARSMPTKVYAQVPSAEAGLLLNAMFIYPPGFDAKAKTKYPVLMHVYGGPNSQQVSKRMESPSHLDFHYYLASSMRVIIVIADNRGTCCRGDAFLKSV
jgi:hypothetical protein